jgi:hypothetical protein
MQSWSGPPLPVVVRVFLAGMLFQQGVPGHKPGRKPFFKWVGPPSVIH